MTRGIGIVAENASRGRRGDAVVGNTLRKPVYDELLRVAWVEPFRIWDLLGRELSRLRVRIERTLRRQVMQEGNVRYRAGRTCWPARDQVVLLVVR